MAPAPSSEPIIAEAPQQGQDAARAEAAVREGAMGGKAGREGAAIKVVYVCLFVEVRASNSTGTPSKARELCLPSSPDDEQPKSLWA
jgi:hypothetical protein